MKRRIIHDCQRDVKGIHQWEFMMFSGDDHLFWCHECGALGVSNQGNPKARGLSTVTVIRRVQE